jgi:prophage antirepressor-like protein
MVIFTMRAYTNEKFVRFVASAVDPILRLQGIFLSDTTSRESAKRTRVLLERAVQKLLKMLWN